MNVDREKDQGTEIFSECEEAIWIIGYGGSGKSTVSGLLQKEYGFTRIELGAQVISSYNEYVSNTSKPSSFLDWLRSELSMGEPVFTKHMLGRHLADNPDDLHAKKVVIPSMRTVAGLSTIQRLFPFAKNKLIYIKSSQELRASRILNRVSFESEDHDLQTMQERDNMESELGIREVIAMADLVIENEGSLDELREKIRNIFSNL